MRILVLDTETTGLPGKTPRHLLRLTEVGAVLVDTGQIVPGTLDAGELPYFQATIQTAEWVLGAPEVQEALGLSDVLAAIRGPEAVPRHVAEDLFVAFLDRVRPDFWTAFNRDFDASFLAWAPMPPATRCLMRWAHALIDRATPGWLPPSTREPGQTKWPRSSEAADWLRQRGHTLAPNSHPHRALPDALAEVEILLGLLREEPDGLGDGYGPTPTP